MNKVILKSLELKNFKGISEARIEFDEKETIISAENGSGKSSIKNAFEWVLCQNVADVLPMLDNKEIPHLETSVIAILNVNGYEYMLERRSKGKYVVNHETGKENKVLNESTYLIDGMDMKEKDYRERLAGLLSNGVFDNLQILTDKEYFNTDTTKFKWNDRRKVLFEMCGVDNAVQSLIVKPEYSSIKNLLEKGNATSDIKSMLAKSKKGYKDQQVKNAILIEQKVQENTTLMATDFEQVERGLQQAQERHKMLLSASNAEQQAEQVRVLQNKIFDLTREKSILESQDLQKRTQLRTLMQSLFNEAQNLKLEFDVEKENYQKFNTELKEGGICPTCHQKIAKVEPDKHSAEHAELISKAQATLEQLKVKYTKKKAEFDETKQKLDNFADNPRINELNNALSSARIALETAKATDLTNLSAQEIISLETQISALNKTLRDKDYIEQNKVNIQMWKDNNKALADKIIDIERQETALASYVKEQTDLIASTVNSKFSNGVSWALYKETYKNGEGGIEEDCICLYKNKRYSSLSMGEKNTANIEVVKALQDYYGVKLPLFCDNQETVTLEYNSDTQIIELRAEKGKKLANVIKIEEIYKGV